MLLAMLTDERCHIRILTARQIIKAREIGPDVNCVLRFVIPAVNIRATDYVGLIDWQGCNVTPSTVLRHISSHELLKMMQDDVPMDGRDFIKFPSHTQTVDRIVKIVAEAFRKRVRPQNRDEFMRATLEPRKQMSKFESKKYYKNSAFVILYVSKVESSFYSQHNDIFKTCIYLKILLKFPKFGAIQKNRPAILSFDRLHLLCTYPEPTIRSLYIASVVLALNGLEQRVNREAFHY
ncbi:hypothetical protein AVEN_231943-1 [Araneus ventricosus]|uniref:Uncharacterized protein n=1 Tax=Araneus ventricosus TaxID=182803 RepID=A0A4Y2C2C5_ARAVE|nr:hypothetical protein AVEN_231943-1 [Araneus ventricosus]